MEVDKLIHLRDRASRVFDWTLQNQDLADPTDRALAGRWFHCISFLTSELRWAETDGYRAVVNDMLARFLKRRSKFDALELRYLESLNKCAEATNRALNLAAGGVEYDGD